MQVMYCTLSSMLAVEARAGRLPPELTRPSLAFFFIEGVFYVTDRYVLLSKRALLWVWVWVWVFILRQASVRQSHCCAPSLPFPSLTCISARLTTNKNKNRGGERPDYIDAITAWLDVSAEGVGSASLTLAYTYIHTHTSKSLNPPTTPPPQQDESHDRRAQLGIPALAPLEVQEMAATTLGGLTLRLGTRYLYCHLVRAGFFVAFCLLRVACLAGWLAG